MVRRTNQTRPDDVARALEPSGLAVRGGFVGDREDGLLASVGTVLLIGNAGGNFWPIFEEWRAGQPARLQNPLDSWSRTVIDAVAKTVGARAIYPSDKPYAPFQQWAIRAEGLKASPLGILMHPQYGLWHAYRGALLFDRELDLPKAHTPIHLCDRCVGKPCKKACPVDAHVGESFDYEGCRTHLRGSPTGDCLTTGCLDRNACPYGGDYRYPAAMQAFIANAFVRA
jgi:ferredoxin